MCLRLDFDKGAAWHATPRTAAIYCLLSSTIFRKYFTIYETSFPASLLPYPAPLCFVYSAAFDAAYELLATANGSVGGGIIGGFFPPEDFESFLPKLG